MRTSYLILLALGTVTLAIPTTDTTDPSLIEKRSSRPWLDSFDSDDVVCQDPTNDTATNYRPFIEAGDCQAYQPYSERIGGSWGAGSFSISNFWAFENDDCTGPVKARINRKGHEHGFCFPLESLGCSNGDLDNPCFWNSVRGNK